MGCFSLLCRPQDRFCSCRRLFLLFQCAVRRATEQQSIDKSGKGSCALPSWISLEACRLALQVSRITFRNSTTGEEVTKELSKEQESNETHYKDKETGAELEVIEKMPLLEWLANNYKKFGCQLEFVTNKSQVQLCKVCICVCSSGQHA